jgi:hypothetical protein
MDMQSDMCDGDMFRRGILGLTITIHPPLQCPFGNKSAQGKSRNRVYRRNLRGEGERSRKE